MNQSFLDRQSGLQKLREHKRLCIQNQILENKDKKIQEFDAEKLHNQKTIAKVAYMTNTPYAVREGRQN